MRSANWSGSVYQEGDTTSALCMVGSLQKTYVEVLLKFLSKREGRTTPTTHDSRGFISSEPFPETISN